MRPAGDVWSVVQAPRRRDGERGPGGRRGEVDARRGGAAAGWSVASLTAITAPPAAIPAASPSAIAARPLTRCSAACAGCCVLGFFWTMKFVEATILLISGRDCGRSNAAVAGTLPFRYRIQAAWRASTVWIPSADVSTAFDFSRRAWPL